MSSFCKFSATVNKYEIEDLFNRHNWNWTNKWLQMTQWKGFEKINFNNLNRNIVKVWQVTGKMNTSLKRLEKACGDSFLELCHCKIWWPTCHGIIWTEKNIYNKRTRQNTLRFIRKLNKLEEQSTRLSGIFEIIDRHSSKRYRIVSKRF